MESWNHRFGVEGTLCIYFCVLAVALGAEPGKSPSVCCESPSVCCELSQLSGCEQEMCGDLVFPPQGWATMRNKSTSWISECRPLPLLRPGWGLVALAASQRDFIYAQRDRNCPWCSQRHCRWFLSWFLLAGPLTVEVLSLELFQMKMWEQRWGQGAALGTHPCAGIIHIYMKYILHNHSSLLLTQHLV